MNFCRRRFNLYLAAASLLPLLTGCSGLHWFHHEKEQVAILKIHIESESSAAGSTKTVSVERSQPVEVNISTDPILTDADVIAARVLAASGGFAVELDFEETAGWRLEQYTAINPGKHLAIFGQWSDKLEYGRWLAAPIIVRRIGNDKLIFTPDASREEIEQWVKGLSAAAKKRAEGNK